MRGYVGQMMILCFIVDFLLLLAVNRMYGYPPGTHRAALAALYGCIYCGACLLPDMAFMNAFYWRMISLVLTGVLAFGCETASVPRGTVFVLLHMALNGIVQSIGEQSVRTYMIAGLCVLLLCVMGLHGKFGKQYVPVELSYGDKRMELTALQDTGNNLRDPVTGKPVLIVDAPTAEGLTGLSHQQLCRPVETMGTMPGLRLIPYKTVGSGGFLLALRLKNVKIGTWQGSSLVAFSPEVLSSDGIFQALTGGAI